MREYKLYSIAEDGHVDGPPFVLEVESDKQALEIAKLKVNGHDIEVWQEARLVAYLTPDKEPMHSE